ncbi:GtrA family protein [Hydrogenophaga pseudoflava]|jgi:putative flippase GtrA|uniref:GtrA family protein n=1 Tax=Hydrogenophaga pseudoflava TaxID=47421 RepID=UPI0008255C75|nr:GtrA family protein [Hydrogenophaga pseudoflava]
MYKWVGELRLLRRYIGSGAVNTLVGVAVIVGLTWLGLNPFLANAIGYVVGLITGYVASRFYTFQSRGPVGQETARYLTAFGVAYGINVATLHVFLSFVPQHPAAGQVLGAVAYSSSMYLFSRFFVFTHRDRGALVKSRPPGT